MTPLLHRLVAVCLLVVPFILPAAPAWRVQVSAGAATREGSVAEFMLPATAPSWRLLDAAGGEVPLQISPTGKASFLIERLALGTRATHRLEADAPMTPAPTAVTFQRRAGRIAARVGGRPVFEFHEESSLPPEPGIKPVFRRAGYLHPVHSPAGLLVTDDYPGDHFHHHGIWWAWTNTRFEGRKPDFWNVGSGTGRVDLLGVDRVWSGPVHGGLAARFQYVDLSAPQPKAALHETWELRLYPSATLSQPCWIFDLTSTQSCAGASPIAFPQYRYGGLGLRGAREWEGRGAAARFLPSNGITDRAKAHESRATWCAIGGLVGGRPVFTSDTRWTTEPAFPNVTFRIPVVMEP